MKIKKLMVLGSMMATLPLTSCNSGSSKIEIKREMGLTDAIVLTGQQLQQKINNEDDFVLYLFDPGCSACQEFQSILTSYVTNNYAVIYKIRGTEVLSSSNITYTTFPDVLVFNDGKIASRTKELSTASLFSSFINKYAYISSRIRITESILDQKIANKESFIINYTWDSCGDCNSANSLFLNEFIKDNTDKVFFELELGEYYAQREDSNDPIWTEMTKKYQLSEEGNSTFGWHNGVVPTFQYYKEGVLSDAVVVFNDDMSRTTDGDGTVSEVKVTGSYFKDAPFIDKSFKATDRLSATQVYRNETFSFYKDKVENLFKNLY